MKKKLYLARRSGGSRTWYLNHLSPVESHLGYIMLWQMAMVRMPMGIKDLMRQEAGERLAGAGLRLL